MHTTAGCDPRPGPQGHSPDLIEKLGAAYPDIHARVAVLDPGSPLAAGPEVDDPRYEWKWQLKKDSPVAT